MFIVLLFLVSCAETDFSKSDQNDYRDKNNQLKIHAGAACSSGCIWSTFAVSNSIQFSSAQCEEGPCACVTKGNANKLCEVINYNDQVLIDNDEGAMMPSGIKTLPYFNQYYNEFYGWATCQNTSIAMVLSFYEKSYYNENIYPDSIYKQWGKDYAQSPSGLNAVYSSYAHNSRITTYTNASPEDLISALQAGYIAIVHGYFTNYGHVLVVRGYENERDGENLGIHEIAHALKLENIIKGNDESDFFDLSTYMDYKALAIEEVEKIKSDQVSFFRSAGGINEHEFFAVALENFFERPHQFFQYHSKLYGTLVRLLRQDPRVWIKN